MRSIGGVCLALLFLLPLTGDVYTQQAGPEESRILSARVLEGGATVSTGVLVPGGKVVRGPEASEPPDPLPLRPMREHPPARPQAPTPEALVAAMTPTVPATEAPLLAPGDPRAPGDIVQIRTTAITDSLTNTSGVVGEPSVAGSGNALFYTGNWYAQKSVNGGQTFSYINPYTFFPSSPSPYTAAFCCDQRVAQDPSRNTTFWFLQYVTTGNTATDTNGVRVAVAVGEAGIANNTWTYYNITPALLGLGVGTGTGGNGQGVWFDYPNMVTSTNYLWLSLNLFRTTGGYERAVVVRFGLADLAAGGAVPFVVYSNPLMFTIMPAAGSTTTTYFAEVGLTSTDINVLTWADGAGAPTVTNVSGLNTTSFASFVCTDPDATNPCTRADFRMQAGWVFGDMLGFLWHSSQGGGFTFPYTRAVFLNRNTLAVVSQPDIWSASGAWLYPSIAPNSRGHYGGTVSFLGGSVRNMLIGLLQDDLAPPPPGWTNFLIQSGNDNVPGLWGDYNGSARHPRFHRTWIGSGFIQNTVGGGGVPSQNASPYFTWFARNRDLPRAPSDFNGDRVSDRAVFRNGAWYVAGGPTTNFGQAGDIPIAGDYDGDGDQDIAVYRPSTAQWFRNGAGTVIHGQPGDIPVVGDYNGDGMTEYAYFRPSTGSWSVNGGATTAWGAPGDIPVPADYDGDGDTDLAVFRPSTGQWLILGIGSFNWGTAGDWPIAGDWDGDGDADAGVYRPSSGTWFLRTGQTIAFGAVNDIPLALDTTGDGVPELTLFRPGTGVWYSRLVSGPTVSTVAFGAVGDYPVGANPAIVFGRLGDVDGDHRADPGVYRPGAAATWFVLRSSAGFGSFVSQNFGTTGDVAVPGDYDGDRRLDFAVYRPSTGTWFVLFSSTNYASGFSRVFGLSTDVPLPADFDGDGRTDLGVYRPASGAWYSLNSGTNYTTGLSRLFGISTDKPVPVDLDGDRRADLLVYRPSTGAWYSLLSSTGYGPGPSRLFGASTDTPAPFDMTGDGKAEFVVYRPSTGVWYWLTSGSNWMAGSAVNWGGAPSDVPVPGDFDGDGLIDIAVWRGASGTWYVRNQYTLNWGLSSDTPTLKR